MLSIYSDQAGAVEHVSGAFGVMVVSEKAVTTGATAVPDPVTEVSSDEWFVYQGFVGPSSTNLTNVGVMNYAIDSRAQRKVQDGEDFVSVIANANGVDGLRFTLSMRFLVKLS